MHEHAKADFGQWFDGSKLVDARGDPMVVYHGTCASFSEPRLNGSGLFFVTPEKASVAEFIDGRPGARIMSFYASIKNAFDTTDEESIRVLIATGREVGWLRGDVATLTYDSGSISISLALLLRGDHVPMESREVVSAIKSMGHDAIRLHERGMTNFAVFDPGQVRLVDGVTSSPRAAAAREAAEWIQSLPAKDAPYA